MPCDAIEGEPNFLDGISILSPSMPTLDVLSKSISQPILDPDDLFHALSPKSHDDPRNRLRQSKYRSHEDHKDDWEEQRQWQECIKNCLEYMKNTYVIVKEWIDKNEALWLRPKLGLDPNGEFKSISSTNTTHPSLKDALD
jgi:hypothetical protein